MSLPVVSPWFELSIERPGLTRIREPGAHRLMRSNMFLIEGRDRTVLFDTGLGVSDLRSVVDGLTGKPLVVVASHGHLDHIGAHHQFAGSEILVHPLEAEALARPDPAESLAFSQFGLDAVQTLKELGFDTDGPLLDALPSAGFDVAGFRATGIAPTRLVGEGDGIDLGDRVLTVLHLPGHSPGGIGLFDPVTGELYAGDAIYEGVLIDSLPGGSVADYVATMHRLKDLPVTTVHGGHNGSFGRERLRAIADGYLAARGA